MVEVSHKLNRIYFGGNLDQKAVRAGCAHLHQIVHKSGFREVIVDFRNVTTVFESFVGPFLAIIRRYQNEGLRTIVELPQNPKLNALFRNTNWAYYLSQGDIPTSTFVDGKHLPIVRFNSIEDQNDAVERVLEVILGSMENLERSHLKALQWALWEITDNVLTHSRSDFGGFIQSTVFSNTRMVEFVVSDAGVGIPKSLNINNQKLALTEAIKEGVTSNRETNQGNGLYGTYRLAVLSNGEIEIDSYNARLYAAGNEDVKIHEHKIPYDGTSIRCRIRCDDESLLFEALKFGDEPYEPAYDHLESKYESENSSLSDLLCKWP